MKAPDSKKLSQSIEDYIERIYLDYLKDQRGVRITDLAQAMNVSKASANDAVKRLKELGYVEHERYRQIYLTPEGEKMAAKIYDKHTTLTDFFNRVLGVSLETAERDACAIEHSISEETFCKIKQKLKDDNES